jgi:putative ABC transport system substrate-binding protein
VDRRSQTDSAQPQEGHHDLQSKDSAVLLTVLGRDWESRLAVEPIVIEVHDDAGIERAISTLSREPDSGLIAMPDSFNMVHRRTIIMLVDRYRLPAMYYFPFFARDGGLISYGPDEADMFRQAAGYVDRILKGAKVSDLPVQQPTKYELVINLKTAKALGLIIPESFLQTADEVIE